MVMRPGSISARAVAGARSSSAFRDRSAVHSSGSMARHAWPYSPASCLIACGSVASMPQTVRAWPYGASSLTICHPRAASP